MRTARLLYAEIGAVLARRGYDPLAGRAVVAPRRRAELVARAAAAGLLEVPRRALEPFRRAPLVEVVEREVVPLAR